MAVIEDRLHIEGARQRMKIVRIHRIGKMPSHPGSNKKIRPILVRFHYFPHVMEIFKKRAELKKTHGAAQELDQRRLTGFSVVPNPPVCTGISQDFPTSVSNIRNQLKQVLKVAKTSDKDAFLKTDQLCFKGNTYTLQQCYKIKELDIHSIGTVNRQNTVLFHGRFSPFSNFYPCSFTHNGVQYNCVEQFYQHQKALHANKGFVATKILLAEDPVEIKHLGDSVDRSNWSDTIAIGAMMTGLRCKFQQNDFLAKILVDTHGRELIECNPHDRFWGNGATIRGKKTGKDLGKNHLGKCLIKVRE